MVTPADWIRVELSAVDQAAAMRRAELRQSYATRRGFTPKGLGSVETNQLGCLGELAVARYEATELDRDWTWEADKRRGCDVAGWQVRASSRILTGLGLNEGDRGKFLLVFGHEPPVMWLAGWISAVAGFKVAEARTTSNGKVWHRVDPKNLKALPEKNGFTRRGDPQLVDPLTPFWCEECHGVHPLIEHRECRTLRHVENSARKQLLAARASRVTSQLYPSQGEEG